MALMKAKTANAKAKSVDQLELALADVAESIAYEVSRGNFVTYAGVPKQHLSAFLLALQKSGYSAASLDFPQLPVRERTWWEKLLFWDLPSGTPCTFIDNGPMGTVRVSWELVRETQKV